MAAKWALGSVWGAAVRRLSSTEYGYDGPGPRSGFFLKTIWPAFELLSLLLLLAIGLRTQGMLDKHGIARKPHEHGPCEASVNPGVVVHSAFMVHKWLRLVTKWRVVFVVGGVAVLLRVSLCASGSCSLLLQCGCQSRWF